MGVLRRAAADSRARKVRILLRANALCKKKKNFIVATSQTLIKFANYALGERACVADRDNSRDSWTTTGCTLISTFLTYNTLCIYNVQRIDEKDNADTYLGRRAR